MRAVDKLLWCCILLMVFTISGCGAVTQATQSSRVAHKPSPTVLASSTWGVKPTTTPSVALPAHLVIPTIGVNAPVENVGIQSNGDLGTPQQNPWEGVGWYKNGPRPGEAGSAVIDGHLDRPGGYPAVFWDLRKMNIGDSVMIVDASGKTIHFRVTRVASYPPQDAPVQEIFGDSGGTYLNLITCAGTWIPNQHQTTLRMVIYTTLAN